MPLYPSPNLYPSPGLLPGGVGPGGGGGGGGGSDPQEPVPLSELALKLIGELPPFMADSYDAHAALAAVANELEFFQQWMDKVQRNFFPQTGDDLLMAWEALLGLAIDPPDKTLEQRRSSVLAFLRSLKSSGSGLDWEATLSGIIGTAWEYQEHIPGDGTTPPAHSIRILLPFPQEMPSPGNFETAAFGTGGGMVAGTYYYVVTAINSYGETIASGEEVETVTGSASRVDLTWDPVEGASGYRVYRGTVSGVYGLLAQTIVTSMTDTGDPTEPGQPPTVNSTASPQTYEAEALARQITPAHIDLIFGYGQGFIVGISQVGEEPL